MKIRPIQLGEEIQRQINDLADRWGLPKQRYVSKVLFRCLEKVYQQELHDAKVENGQKKRKE